jgi:MFS family permease
MTLRGINWAGIGFGFGLMALAAYQQLKLPPALPVLIEAYGFERILGGAFMSVYALSGLLLSLRLGGLIQRHGAVVFLYAAFAMFALAAMAMMVWPENGWLFLAARAVEGVAFAILAIAGPSICTANAGPGGLAIASGIVAAWIPVGGLIASLVAAGIGLGDSGGNWRVLWIIGIAATAALAFWTWRLQRQGGIDLGRPHGDTNAAPTTLPATRKQLRDMTLAAFLFTLWSVQFFAYVTWLPAYLVETRGISVANAAALFMIPTALVILFNLLAAPILRAGMPVALLLAAAATVQGGVWLVLPVLGPVAAGIAAFGVYAAAAGLTPTCLFAMPGTIFGVDRATAKPFAVLMTGRNLGVLLGPVVTGWLVQQTGGWETLPPTLGAVTLALAAGALILHRRLGRTAG